MTFQFAYKNILNLKEKEKDQAYNELGLSLRKKEMVLAELQTVIEEREQRLESWRKGTENTIATMKQRNKYLGHLNRKVKKMEEQIVEAEKEISEKKAIFLDKQKDEKVWHHLRDKSFDEYVQKQKKIEQDFLDEMAVIRHFHHRRE